MEANYLFSRVRLTSLFLQIHNRTSKLFVFYEYRPYLFLNFWLSTCLLILACVSSDSMMPSLKILSHFLSPDLTCSPLMPSTSVYGGFFLCCVQVGSDLLVLVIIYY